MIVASPGTIIVAITTANNNPFPLKSRNENANAASEHEMICPIVIHPAMMNEFTINRNNGTVVNASLKFCNVGCFGMRCLLHTKVEVKSILQIQHLPQVLMLYGFSFSQVPWHSFYSLIPEVRFLINVPPLELPYFLTDSLIIHSLLFNTEHYQRYQHDDHK